MIQNLNTIISNKLTDASTGFAKSFADLMNSGSLSPVEFIISNVINHLNSFISADIVSRIYNNPSIVDQVSTDGEKLFETNKYNEYIAKFQSLSLKIIYS